MGRTKRAVPRGSKEQTGHERQRTCQEEAAMSRKMKKLALFSFASLITFNLIFWFGQDTLALDANALLKQVNKELRQAQNDMFAGKTDKAIAALESIKKGMMDLRGVDPNNTGLKAAEGKYGKLVKDLERRTGKDLGGGTLTAAEASAQTALPPKPEAKPMPDMPIASPAPGEAKSAADKTALPAAKVTGTDASVKMPNDARRPLRDAATQIGRIDGYVEKLDDPNSGFNKEQLVRNMDESLANARAKLDEAKALAAKKGVSSHPDFETAEADLVAAEQKAAEAKKRFSEVQATSAAASKEVDDDIKTLLDEYKRAEPLFAKATGTVMYYNDLAAVKELLSQIESFENNDLDKINASMKTFSQKYGSTADEIDKKANAMGYAGQNRASFPYTELSAGIQNVQLTRTVMADDLVRRAADMKAQVSKGVGDFARTKQYGRIREWGELAVRMDKENPRVKAFNSGLDGWIKEDMKALHAKIDKVTWPGHADNAPDDAKKLAKIAVEFLQKEEGKREEKNMEVGKVLAVAVTGPWRVFKKNLLGEPIQYNLPILCAVEYKSDKDLNAVRVYDSTLLTEEYKGVKMAPPFLGATVGNSYYIRASAIE